MPARIAGVTLPQNKRIEIALTYIFGIGVSRSRKILSKAQIDHNKKTQDLGETEVNTLREIIERDFKVEGDLRRAVLMNIKRLKEIGAYRGTRHSKNLPARGQRTKTNSRTVRGNVRRTMGSGRRKSADKT
ncbi:MAG: 30S ribosomal protein S13 [Patescibacteria group bacterium]|nr:30S ribosomal protein S13 [Patescibacteria group bacterium]MDD5715077.1 30S ribosomal protein S13 [Patescibacteria group bacterium]